MIGKRTRVKKVFLPLVLVSMTVAVLAYGVVQHHQNCGQCLGLQIFTPEVIRHYIRGFGAGAIVVYILLYAVNTVTLLPPIAMMSLSAGFLFGPLMGIVALTSGSFLGTTATFFIARFFGGAWVDRIFSGAKVREFQENLGGNGFWVILPIRLIGFPPWEVVNYVSGLSKIRYRDYISATMLGIAPAIVIQVFFSDRLTKLDLKDPTLYAAVGAFVILAVVPAILLKAGKKNNSALSPSDHRLQG
jgi:uncharacterized membrane protein YdjX (TVP38/TMEM64 family)